MSENDSLIMPNHHKDNALTFEPCSRAYLVVSGAKKKVLSMIFSAHGIAFVSSIKKNIMTIFSLMTERGNHPTPEFSVRTMFQ